MPKRSPAPSRGRLPSPEERARGLRREGEALVKKGRLQDAVGRFSSALEALPGDAATLFQLALTASRLGMVDGAVRFYEQILAHQGPEAADIQVLVNLGTAYRAASRTDDAVALLRTALEARNDEAPLWHALGSAVRDMGDRAAARTFFSQAVRLDPRHGAALGSLADLDLEEGDLAQALERYDAALRVTRKSAEFGAQLHLSRALALLQAGRLEDGWAAYGHRFTAQGAAAPGGGRLWTGQPFKGRPLTILREQGIGDQIMFAGLVRQILTDAQDAPSHVTLTCEPRLVPLLARSLRCVTVTARPHKTAGPGWILPLGEVPARRWPARVPDRQSPYLTPAPERRKHWASWLDGLPPGPRMGLCWRSGKRQGLRAGAYAPLEAWIRLARMARGPLICAHYEPSDDDLAAFEAGGVRLHRPPGIDQRQDIDDATTLLSCLDVVITAPTAVAYQAALSGTRTIRLLPHAWWTHLGTGADAFALMLEDIIAPHPEDWDSVFKAAADRHPDLFTLS